MLHFTSDLRAPYFQSSIRAGSDATIYHVDMACSNVAAEYYGAMIDEVSTKMKHIFVDVLVRNINYVLQSLSHKC